MVSSDTERREQQGPPGPLSGLRVLELATLIAGPFAGRYLADFGAEVIKIEQPGTGDPLRYWGKRADSVESRSGIWSSRAESCRSLPTCTTPAIKRSSAASRCRATCCWRTFDPVGWRNGISTPHDLVAANPRLIVVRISGYGQDGPLRDQPGFGTIAEAAGGMRYVTGDPDRPPARTGLSLGDSIPSLHALVGLLIALHERNSSGRGQIVDVSLADSIFAMLEGILPEYAYLGLVRERSGGIAHNSGPTNTYPCADGSCRVHRGQHHGTLQDGCSKQSVDPNTRTMNRCTPTRKGSGVRTSSTAQSNRGRRDDRPTTWLPRCAFIACRSVGSAASPRFAAILSSSPAR